MTSEAVPGPASRTRAAQWVEGCRPRTLPAAVVPVLVGTCSAVSLGDRHLTGGSIVWWRAVAALVVALAVQVGTNLANDYADGVRGTDDARVGPTRLVASGVATPKAVRNAALASFGVAAVAGLALAVATTWWLLVIGAACFVAGWTYTGGPAPYGYLGLGEVFVLAFFGGVATVGSAYVQLGHWWWLPVLASLPVGFVAVALLEANNLRDLQGDAAVGKRTLAVRLGGRRAPWLYVGALLAAGAGVAAVAVLRPWALVALLVAPLAVEPVRRVRRGATGRELLPVLGATGRLQLLGGVALAVGLLV